MTTSLPPTFPDLNLISSGPDVLPPLRLSPAALSEIIETFQRIQNRKEIFLFGTLMGSINAQGEYLVSSVVCLYYEMIDTGENSEFELKLPNKWSSIIENHQNFYASKCLGAFLVNSRESDILDAAIIECITGYMRSKMESQLANLLLKVRLDPNVADYGLRAFLLHPNKYFIDAFVNMSQIPVRVDYLPETARHVHQNLLFYQMQRSELKELELQTLDKLIKIVDGSIQLEEDDVGLSEGTSPQQVPLARELLDKLNRIFKCRKRIDADDLQRMHRDFQEQKGDQEQLMDVLQAQVLVAKNLALGGSSKK